ncbi:hypothetical protein K239x_45100 [Planctomycetes bacterium K23_9]|uniref:Uncharacterized protein n=1 Tax=Stieleria marina TaxID=1930275 RepID=A0A517NZE3_9BACT|nr:hypothetical protein K239x_45100 [Planctomycetes bacterium K23_9]
MLCDRICIATDTSLTPPQPDHNQQKASQNQMAQILSCHRRASLKCDRHVGETGGKTAFYGVLAKRCETEP